jgi:outer membrane protein assembly factor BamB
VGTVIAAAALVGPIGLALLLVSSALGSAVLVSSPGGPTIRSAGTGPRVSPTDVWATYLHDPQRSSADLSASGLSAATAPNLTLLWKFPTKGWVVAGPTVVGSSVYVGSWDGYEYALNSSTGAKRWATFVGQSSHSKCGSTLYGVTASAALVNGTLYVGGGNAKWYALDPTTGKVVWKVALGDAATVYDYSSPLIVGHHGYIGTASYCDRPLVRGQLLELGLDVHRVVRSFGVVPPGQIGGAIWSSPTYDPASNTIFVTTGNGQNSRQSLTEAFVALDASTLSKIGSWQVPTGATGVDSDFGSTPTLVAPGPLTHLVVASNKNGVLYAMPAGKLASGPAWKVTLAAGGPCPQCGNGSISPAAFDGRTLYAAGGQTSIRGTSFAGSVRALSPTNGSLRWATGTPSPVLAPVSYADGLVVVASGSTLELLNASTGGKLYNFTAGGKLWGPVAVVDGCLFFGSLDQNVYAIGLPGSTCVPRGGSGSGHGPRMPVAGALVPAPFAAVTWTAVARRGSPGLSSLPGFAIGRRPELPRPSRARRSLNRRSRRCRLARPD